MMHDLFWRRVGLSAAGQAPPCRPTAGFRRSWGVALLSLLVIGSAFAGENGEDPTEQWLDAHRDPDQKQYFGEPIDLSLKDADLVDVLRSFAEIGRFNLIVQPGVEGTVTVELKQVPWDQALEAILKINGLGMEITGGKINVAPRGGRAQAVSFELITVRLEPVHADAQVIARALNHPEAGVPSPGGVLRAEGGTLVIRDTREALRDFARVLSYVDVPLAAQENPEDLAARIFELWNRLVPERPIAARP